MKIKHVNVEYIESGTFCGGEEDCYNADIKCGNDYIVISPEDFTWMQNELRNFGFKFEE